MLPLFLGRGKTRVGARARWRARSARRLDPPPYGMPFGLVQVLVASGVGVAVLCHAPGGPPAPTAIGAAHAAAASGAARFVLRARSLGCARSTSTTAGGRRAVGGAQRAASSSPLTRRLLEAQEREHQPRPSRSPGIAVTAPGT